MDNTHIYYWHMYTLYFCIHLSILRNQFAEINPFIIHWWILMIHNPWFTTKGLNGHHWDPTCSIWASVMRTKTCEKRASQNWQAAETLNWLQKCVEFDAGQPKDILSSSWWRHVSHAERIAVGAGYRLPLGTSCNCSIDKSDWNMMSWIIDYIDHFFPEIVLHFPDRCRLFSMTMFASGFLWDHHQNHSAKFEFAVSPTRICKWTNTTYRINYHVHSLEYQKLSCNLPLHLLPEAFGASAEVAASLRPSAAGPGSSWTRRTSRPTRSCCPWACSPAWPPTPGALEVKSWPRKGSNDQKWHNMSKHDHFCYFKLKFWRGQFGEEVYDCL